MFTGLAEEVGVVEKITPGKILRLTVSAPQVFAECAIGDSIAVNGVCLTVTRTRRGHAEFDVMDESRKHSTLAGLTSGERVNLERAVRASGRLGGHIVSGHIDGVGTAVVRPDGRLRVAAGAEIIRYLIPRGSVAIDGISLTVTCVDDDWFETALIPHTLALTNLGAKRRSTPVNIEVDMLAKYVFRYLERYSGTGGLSIESLRQFGFDE